MQRMDINRIKAMKAEGKKLVMLTAYDYSIARIVDECDIPLVLVGDSLGMVMLGYDSTVPVTMEEMLHHTKAVVRGTSKALVVADMPFLSYQISAGQALENAGRFLQEAGAQAVKLEGGENIAATVERIVSAGIPVMGHIGLTPQYVNQLGGYRVQGKTLPAAIKLFRDAISLEKAGVFAIVFETVPAPVAGYISQRLTIPVIGIGAGAGCDGQVQVINDLLGSFTDFRPKHARRYANLAEIASQAVTRYRDEVTAGQFPGEENSSTIDETIFSAFLKEVE